MTATEPASGSASLLDTANALAAERAAIYTRCPIARLMATMPNDHAAQLRTLFLMDRMQMPLVVIHETLKTAGYPTSDKALGNHRRRVTGGAGGCQCPIS